jgi:hypothetical protein
MSDFGSSSNPQVGPHANPAHSEVTTAWRRIRDSARNSFARRKQLASGMLLALLALPVTAAIVWYATRPNALKKAADIGLAIRNPSALLNGGGKPKPAPGKPMLPVAPPAAAPPLPMPSAAAMPTQQAPAQVQIPPNNMTSATTSAPIAQTAPPATVVPAKPPYSPVVYHARHEKHFGEGCSGQLTLSTSGLVFNCPDDLHGSVQIAVNEIGSVDENGIRLTSGKKYHFSIPGMTKTGEERLFADWLNRVR